MSGPGAASAVILPAISRVPSTAPAPMKAARVAVPTAKTAAALIIGNEILSGRTQDANLAFLAQQLNLFLQKDLGERWTATLSYGEWQFGSIDAPWMSKAEKQPHREVPDGGALIAQGEDGLPVYGFGGAKTPLGFQQSCTRFFDVAALARNEAHAADTAPSEPDARQVDPNLLELLGSAYKASERDQEGYTTLSEIGQRAKAVSSFATRNYGYTRLSDLIRAMPNFEVKTGAP